MIVVHTAPNSLAVPCGQDENCGRFKSWRAIPCTGGVKPPVFCENLRTIVILATLNPKIRTPYQSSKSEIAFLYFSTRFRSFAVGASTRVRSLLCLRSASFTFLAIGFSLIRDT